MIHHRAVCTRAVRSCTISEMQSRPSGWNGTIPLSQDEHYFRNGINLEFSWSELQKLNERLPDSMKWSTIIADLHQHNTVNRTFASLSKGTLANGVNVGEYMASLGFNGGIIPNINISEFEQVFMNGSFTYQNAYSDLLNYANLYNQNSPWAQKWQKANYANSVTGR